MKIWVFAYCVIMIILIGILLVLFQPKQENELFISIAKSFVFAMIGVFGMLSMAAMEIEGKNTRKMAQMTTEG